VLWDRGRKKNRLKYWEIREQPVTRARAVPGLAQFGSYRIVAEISVL
jgi:hypothetical protein